MKNKIVLPFVAILFLVLFVSVGSAFAWTLLSPLAGDITDRTIVGYSFGDNWYEGYCGGYVKKHTGVDVNATLYEPVYAAYSGWVEKATTDDTWGGVVAIDHSPTHTFLLTTVYWHIIPVVSEDSWVSKGDVIGYIAYLSTGTHFHFGIREAGYSYISYAGALPQTNCGDYPAYPSYFLDPMSLQYEYNDN
jgi:murein DD-endopeptidase MepM/ murein hydrolase activator NlpD